MINQVVIVGASHAAAESIASLRKLGWSGSIVLIGDEASLPYQRPPLSKAYYKGEMPADKLLLRPDSFYQKNEVELMLGKRVTRIDRKQKQIVLNDDTKLSYQYLILATGTRARKLNIDGAEHENIHYLRTKNDVDKIKASLKQNATLLIVGAGYIGLEVAASARKQGMKVVVLETMERVLARVTSPEVSEFYQSIHRQEGVELRLNTSLQNIKQTSNGLTAVCTNGDEISFDSAVIGIGVLPNIELAEDAGLNCDNGIVVNEYTQTNDEHIYSIGDCSYHHNILYNRNIRLESVPNAVEQAKVAASHISGKPIIYNQLPWFWSDQYDVKLQTAGLFQGYDQIVVRGEANNRKFAAFYLKEGILIAVDALNSPAEFMLSKKLIQSKASPNVDQLANPDISLKTLI